MPQLRSLTDRARQGASVPVVSSVLPAAAVCLLFAALGQSGSVSAAPALLEGIRTVSVGRSHACAITTSGAVTCWGSNADGQLGDGTRERRLTPVAVVGLSSGFVAVDAGAAHTCALRIDGLLKCWGANAVGQLGNGSLTSSLVPVDVLVGVTAFSVGTYHSCVVNESRSIQCWGQNGAGELGLDPASAPYSPVPLTISALRGTAVSIASGAFHTCAVSVSGAAACWGDNIFGQLGDGTMTSRADPVTPIGLRNGVSSISTGQYHTCVRLAEGGVRCWGGNLAGALGDGTTFESWEPIEPRDLGNVAAVVAGGLNTCAITQAGGVKCWGLNTHGQVGDGTFVSRLVPTDTLASEAVTAIDLAGAAVCAVTNGGRLYCWGDNLEGQLGANATARRLTPVEATPSGDPTSRVAPGGSHTCAVTSAGRVRCWGYNREGQVGDGTSFHRLEPVDVGLEARQVGVVAGVAHTCSLSAEGSVACWGSNPSGQLGDGTLVDRNAPTPASQAGTGFVALAAGNSHTCGVTVARTVKCWGENSSGQLGDGTFESRLTAVDVPAVVEVIAITAGAVHTCALTAGRTLKCWGGNMFGQLGDGTLNSRSAAADVLGLAGRPIAVAAGHQHTCAVLESGAVNCWGKNGAGQLGDGTLVTRGLPINVVNLPGSAIAVTAGFAHSCALAVSGEGWCWGDNTWGQLGDNSMDLRTVPVTVLALAGGAAGIVAGGLHTCALMLDAAVKCWGHNLYGQIGDGTAFGRPVPQYVMSSKVEPGRPILVRASAGTGSADLDFLPPEGDGGSPIIGYTASCMPGPVGASATASPIHVTGLQDATRYSCAVSATNAVGMGSSSDPATVITAPNPSPAPRLVNGATRGRVGSGDERLIGGFALEGPRAKTVVVRARGPSLAPLGVTDSLADPKLELYSGANQLVASVDDWQSDANSALIASLGLAPADPREAAIIRTLPPGLYTTVVSGSRGGTGVGIVEVFEVDLPEDPLVNISARALVMNGNDAMIAGFVIQGSGPQTVAIRARGPSLAPYGIASPLMDPFLDVVRSSDRVVVARNDDWEIDANAAELASRGYAPAHSKEAAVLLTLAPGAYTVIVTGANGGVGVAVVDVHAVP